MQSELKELYLATLRDTLTGKTYGDGCVARRSLRRLFRVFGVHIGRPTTDEERDNGRIWPETAMTMSGTKRLDNIRECLDACDRDGIEGDFVECGVWRGGVSIYAAAVIRSNESARHVYACDSFEGLPKPKSKLDLIDPCRFWRESDVLRVDKETVWRNFCRFGLGGENVHLVKGWFASTLKSLPCRKIAVLRADGDMYESTRDILCLYPKVPQGGFVIVDDYGAVPACKSAVDEFLSANEPKARIETVDYACIYWRKE